ncbi:Zinc finger C2HC domain-containing protein 1C [Rhizoclosmatium sp. JEL0117]|nr:Zinc finger C2HC domain-containing protein 1C [Rhizoclosmatium sp. JEL0117]
MTSKLLALHQNKCLRRQISSASLSGKSAVSSPPKKSVVPQQPPQFQGFGGGFKMTATKRHLSSVPTVFVAEPEPEPVPIPTRTLNKQQSFKRISLKSGVALAAEELNMNKMDLAHSVTNLVYPKAQQNEVTRKMSPQKPRAVGRSDSQQEYIDYSNLNNINTPPLAGRQKVGKTESLDVEQVPIRGTTQSSVHRPSSFNNEVNDRRDNVESYEPSQSVGYPQFANEDETGGGDFDRLPCPICKRKFAGEERLEKHIGACSKMKQPRKIFDATKARVKGTELEQYAMKKALSEGSSKKNDDKPIKPSKQNWRVKHANFIRMVRSNRNPDDPSTPAPVSEPDPDYVQCEHCSRRFNQTAAERHIPICANTKHRPKPAVKGGALAVAVAEDEARMRKRLDFKPPPPKVRKSPEKGSRK